MRTLLLPAAFASVAFGQVKLILSQSKERNPQQAEKGDAQMQQCV
jgi:hypothetical protein